MTYYYTIEGKKLGPCTLLALHVKATRGEITFKQRIEPSFGMGKPGTLREIWDREEKDRDAALSLQFAEEQRKVAKQEELCHVPSVLHANVTTSQLIISIAFPLLYAFFFVWSAVSLSTHYRELNEYVTVNAKLEPLAERHQVTQFYSYEYEGKTYKHEVSVLRDLSEFKGPDNTIQVHFRRANPADCVFHLPEYDWGGFFRGHLIFGVPGVWFALRWRRYLGAMSPPECAFCFGQGKAVEELTAGGGVIVTPCHQCNGKGIWKRD